MTFLVPGGGRVASSHWADGEYKETGQWSVLQSYNLSATFPCCHEILITQCRLLNGPSSYKELNVSHQGCISCPSVCLGGALWRTGIMGGGRAGPRTVTIFVSPHTPQPSQSRHWHFVANVINGKLRHILFLFKAVWIVEYQWVILIFVWFYQMAVFTVSLGCNCSPVCYFL